jgi:hypothetical protein
MSQGMKGSEARSQSRVSSDITYHEDTGKMGVENRRLGTGGNGETEESDRSQSSHSVGYE